MFNKCSGASISLLPLSFFAASDGWLSRESLGKQTEVSLPNKHRRWVGDMETICTQTCMCKEPTGQTSSDHSSLSQAVKPHYLIKTIFFKVS